LGKPYSSACYAASILRAWQQIINCKQLIALYGRNLKKVALSLIYGPFNNNDTYTQKSNKLFNRWLRKQNSLSCIQNFEEASGMMASNTISLLEDMALPANNRMLVFKKSS
jgi:hypothetical protein